MVATEEERCRRFERGLHKKIRTPVMVLGLRSDFSQLVETTLRVEQSLEKDGSK